MKRSPFLLACAVVVAVAALVYRPALSAYFFDDDFQWLIGTWTFDARHLIDIPHLRHFYRPVIELYFAVATPLFGGSATLFHVTNIVLHAANGVLLLVLARQISSSLVYGFLASLFFVIQPGDVDAVAWVSALAEPVSAFFGCFALFWFLRFRRSGGLLFHALSVLALLLALLTHESAVVFVPLMVIADWASGGVGSRTEERTRPAVWRTYGPYAIVTAVYLAVDLSINSRNYVVTQGHYAFGRHAFMNGVDYISALYVGRGDVWNYAFIAVGLALLFLMGSRRVVFAASWMVLALLPFVFFTWSNTSRYLYLPAMGFSMLVADAVVQLDRFLASRVGAMARQAVVVVVVAAIAGRFAVFAVRNVSWFAQRAEDYRRYITLFRDIHGHVPANSRVAPDPRLRTTHSYNFLTAAVRWEYRDPTIELVPDPARDP